MGNGVVDLVPLRPRTVILLVALVACGGAALVGFVAPQSEVVGVDLPRFALQSALLWVAGVAQLVLAFAVWAQIRASERGIAQVEMGLTQDREREITRRYEEEARVLSEFVGHATNASSLYHQAAPALSQVAYSGGSSGNDWARRTLERADTARQLAYVAHFRVRAYSGVDSEAHIASEEFLKLVTQQHQRADRVFAWARNPNKGATFPNPNNVRIGTKGQRERCLSELDRILTARPVVVVGTTPVH